MALPENLASPARVYDFNGSWLFGGPYVSGSEVPGHADGGFAEVVVLLLDYMLTAAFL